MVTEKVDFDLPLWVDSERMTWKLYLFVNTDSLSTFLGEFQYSEVIVKSDGIG